MWPNFLPCGLISDTEANFSVPVSGILAFLRTLSSPNFRHKNIRTYLLHRQIKESDWENGGRVPLEPGNSAHSFFQNCRQELPAFQGSMNGRYSGTFSSITKHISCCRLILLDVWPYFAEQCCQIWNFWQCVKGVQFKIYFTIVEGRDRSTQTIKRMLHQTERIRPREIPPTHTLWFRKLP